MASDTGMKSNFKRHFAKDFVDDFSESTRDHFFVFYSKVDAWRNAENVNIDTTPPATVDAFVDEPEAWNNMLGAIKIRRSDISLVIPRINWVYNTTYDRYQDDTDMFDDSCPSNFYVVNSENRVYKCISNKSRGVVIPSTVEPNSTSVSVFRTQDGYKWKFMYQVPEDLTKFMSDDFVPVETLKRSGYTGERSLQYDIQQNAVDGSIDQVDIVRVGSYFPNVVITEPGGIENVISRDAAVGDTVIYANAANINAVADVGKLAKRSIYIYTGSGAGQYIEITQVSISAGEAVIELASGLTSALQSSGTNISKWEILPTIVIKGNGSGAIAIPRMYNVNQSGSIPQYTIEEVYVANRGRDYTIVDATVKTTEGDALGVESTLLKAHISPPGGHGKDAEMELGARDAVVTVSTRGDVEGKFTVLNDFRRFGIIKNPLIYKGENAGLLAGTEGSSRIGLKIERPTMIIVKFDHYSLTGDGTPINRYVTGPNGQFLLGSTVVQEQTGAKGIVVDWRVPGDTPYSECVLPSVDGTPIIRPDGTFITGSQSDEVLASKLVIEVTEGTFVGPDGGGQGLYIREQSTGLPSYDWYGTVDNFIPALNYTDSTFDENSFIIGTQTKSTAKIVGWEPLAGDLGRKGTLFLSNVNGDFQEPSTDPYTGTLIPGERIVQFVDINQHTGVVDMTNIHPEGNKETNIGIIVEDPGSDIAPTQAYRQTWKLNISGLDANTVLTEDSYPRDALVSIRRDGSEIGTAVVVEYAYTSVQGGSGVIHLTNLRGWDREFRAGDQIHYDVTNTTSTLDSANSAINPEEPNMEYPELLPDSGELLYIQNMTPLMRNIERTEEVRLLLKF